NKHPCKSPNCGWSFKRYEHLKRHLLVHSKERSFVCDFSGCDKSFSRSDNFSAHLRTHSKKGSDHRRRNSHQDLRGFQFTNAVHGIGSQLQYPSTPMNEDEPMHPLHSNQSFHPHHHTCSVIGCSKRFKRLEHLKRHIKTHTQERPFNCPYTTCSKRFSRSDNLAQHVKTHQRQ
ncbi:hypothetical protein EDD21DRAFT_288330, partial [Dissophora ornata]